MATLKQLREQAHMTQMEAATKIGVDKMTVYKWEQGANTPQFRYVRALAEVYGVSLETIDEAIKVSKKQ